MKFWTTKISKVEHPSQPQRTMPRFDSFLITEGTSRDKLSVSSTLRVSKKRAPTCNLPQETHHFYPGAELQTIAVICLQGKLLRCFERITWLIANRNWKLHWQVSTQAAPGYQQTLTPLSTTLPVSSRLQKIHDELKKSSNVSVSVCLNFWHELKALSLDFSGLNDFEIVQRS